MALVPWMGEGLRDRRDSEDAIGASCQPPRRHHGNPLGTPVSTQSVGWNFFQDYTLRVEPKKDDPRIYRAAFGAGSAQSASAGGDGRRSARVKARMAERARSWTSRHRGARAQDSRSAQASKRRTQLFAGDFLF